MKIRNLIILGILLATVLIFRGTGIYYVLKGPDWERLQGFDASDVKRGLLEVTTVTSRDISGNITPATRAGLKPKDHILAIYNGRGEGREIRSMYDYMDVARSMRIGEPWTLIVLRSGPDGKEQQLRLQMPAVPISSISSVSRLVSFGAGIFLPLVAIATGAFIGFSRPEDRNAFMAGLLFLSFSFVSGVRLSSLPDFLRTFCFYVAYLMGLFLPYVFMRFFLFFPSHNLIDRKLPWLKHVVLVLLLAGLVEACFLSWYFLRNFVQFEALRDRFHGMTAFLTWSSASGPLVGLIALVISTFKVQSKDEKRRMSILLAGTLIGVLPLIVYFIYVSRSQNYHSLWALGLVVLTLMCFPLSFIYVVLRHRVFGIRVILRRGLQYALISRGFRFIEAVILFMIFYFASKHIFMRYVHFSSPILLVSYTAVVTGLITALLPRMNKPVMSALDRRFFREAYNAQQVLTDLSRAVRKLAAQPEELLRTVSEKISDSLYPDQVAIFLRDHSAPVGMALAVREKANSGVYRCYRRTQRTTVSATESAMLAEKTMVLAENTLVARYLEKAAEAEPEAIDVYLDNPRSWAHALAKTDEEREQKERKVLEELNTKLIIPLGTGDRILGFISLGEKMSEEPYSKEDKELLLTVAEQTTIALDYAQLIEQVAEQEKLKREMEIAKQVQAHLFPQILPVLKSLDYIGLCQAARGVGGDYYDFLELREGRLGIALGDVSGKGISAALLMASLQALLRSHAPQHGANVDSLLSQINRLMYESTAGSKYATFFYALYDEIAGALTYVNAGHLPPLLFRPNKTAPANSLVESGPFVPFAFEACQVTRLKTGGTVLGIFSDSHYRKETLPVQNGDVLVVYSDGLSEALNDQDEEFGEMRLAAVIAENLHLPAVDLKDLILKRLAEFVGQVPQYDDLTLVIAKFDSL